MNYADAAALLAGRCKDRRKLQNNTYLERRAPFYRRTGPAHGDAFAVRLHATDILTLVAAGRMELDTGGWNTVTTRDRLSFYLPRPWHVWSDHSTLVLGTYQDGFQGHVLVNPCAAIRPDGSAEGASYGEYRECRDTEERATRRVRTRLRRWVQKARSLYIDRSACEYGMRKWGL